MKLLFIGITNHHHIQNFSKSIKKNLGYKLYAINLNPNYIDNKSEKDLFEKEFEVKRYKSRFRDFFSKVFSPIRMLISLREKIDVVQFHMISLYTLPLAVIAKIKGMKVSCFVWGSEFLRANKIMKRYFYFVFKNSDSVVSDSTSLCEKLQEEYSSLKSRISYMQFGSTVIDDLLQTNYDSQRVSLKTIVMCGYNGSPDQKQFEMIEALHPLKDQLYLILPMTYSCDEEHRRVVRDNAQKYGFEFQLLDHFIEGEEWENYIKMTDVFIHMQSTDSFSSSVAEQLLLGHVVINGEWLEYKDLDKEGVFYIKSNISNLFDIVREVVEDKNKFALLCKGNKEKIIKLKSLNYCVNNYWKPYFEELLKTETD